MLENVDLVYRWRSLHLIVFDYIQVWETTYFYQDGQEILMPNVIRTVTRSTMISQYLMFCEEEQEVPLSRATLFRILELREAS